MNALACIPALQGSIAPCVLISGAGLLLLSMSNRLARPIERIRYLCEQIKAHPNTEHSHAQEQITILYKRSKLLRNAILCITCSIALVTVIILLLFLGNLFVLPVTILIDSFFILSLVFLTISMVFFLLDIYWSLDSLRIEIRHTQGN